CRAARRGAWPRGCRTSCRPAAWRLARHSYVVCEAGTLAACEQRLDAAAALVRPEVSPVEAPDPDAPFAMPAGLLDVDE
ncbi:hypothetical protein ABZ885_30630, partial [Kitasatospora sp. NPDC047058]